MTGVQTPLFPEEGFYLKKADLLTERQRDLRIELKYTIRVCEREDGYAELIPVIHTLEFTYKIDEIVYMLIRLHENGELIIPKPEIVKLL